MVKCGPTPVETDDQQPLLVDVGMVDSDDGFVAQTKAQEVAAKQLAAKVAAA